MLKHKLPWVVATTSHKGGVGKTTVALLLACAAQRAITGDPPTVGLDGRERRALRRFADQFKHVLLIDADTAGTELASLSENGEYKSDEIFRTGILGTTRSLQEVLTRLDEQVSDRFFADYLWSDALEPMRSGPPAASTFTFPLVPTYTPETYFHRPTRTRWAHVLEEGGARVKYRWLELLKALHTGGPGLRDLFVVIDCPAFDVGFAKLCVEALETFNKDNKDSCQSLRVVGPDKRDIQLLVSEMEVARWANNVLNGASWKGLKRFLALESVGKKVDVPSSGHEVVEISTLRELVGIPKLKQTLSVTKTLQNLLRGCGGLDDTFVSPAEKLLASFVLAHSQTKRGAGHVA